MGTVDLNTEITLPDGYMTDAIVNLSCSVWGFPLNIFILVTGTMSGMIHSRFKNLIIAMTICNLYGTLGQTILYSLYLYAAPRDIHTTVLTCSIIRRILQVTALPSWMSVFVVSLDRFCLIVLHKTVSQYTILLLFGMLFFYAHGVYNVIELALGSIGQGDMCGPTLVMPRSVSFVLQPIVPIVIFSALIINIRIFYFLRMYKRDKEKFQLSGRELDDTRRAMTGLLVQTIVPCVFVLPQVINFAMYNISREWRFSKQFWIVINGLGYLSFFINPMVTVIFVRPFRLAAARAVGWPVTPSVTPQDMKRSARDNTHVP